MRYRFLLSSLLFLTATLQAAEPAKPPDSPQPVPNSADGVSIPFCDVTELHGQFTFGAEYLFWGVSGDRLLALAATGPPAPPASWVVRVRRRSLANASTTTGVPASG